MSQYIIPKLEPLVIRDGPWAEDLDQPNPNYSQQDIAEMQEVLRDILGPNTKVAEGLKEYGLHVLRAPSSKEGLMEVFGITMAEATKLWGLQTFGKRMFGYSYGTFPFVRGIQDVDLLYRYLAGKTKEELIVLLINNRYQIVHEEVIHSSDGNLLSVSPLSVLHPAAKRDMTAIILVHNHPSGISNPSPEDIEFTKRIIEASKILNITLLDHVIIARDGAKSCLPPVTKPS